MSVYDVIVIGGGLFGCFAARALARYDLKIALLEQREDLCTGISKANTAIVYSGCDTMPGTLKTSMCVTASQGFAGLCDELGVRYSQCGSVMVCFGERGEELLREKLRKGTISGVRDMRLLSRDEVLELEPNISTNARSGLFVPDTGTVLPWDLCFAAAGNAYDNGVEFFFNTGVTGIAESGGVFVLSTYKTDFQARAVINCAGLAADKVHALLEPPDVVIVPSAGDYFILDTKAAGFVKHVIFHESEEKGKGLTLVPTVDGNILAGPTVRPGDDFRTSHEGFDLLHGFISEVMPSLPVGHIIRSFGAVRANPRRASDGANIRDICIVESNSTAPFISLIGTKTPGMTRANEMGLHIARMVTDRLGAVEKVDFISRRSAAVRLSDLEFDDRQAFVCSNPDYGKIVCRCRGVSEGEIIDSIRSFPGACTVEGVKYRTGAGSGRCQGGFCCQSVEELLVADPSAEVCSSMEFHSMSDIQYDIIIIGGGASGMAAALSASAVDESLRILIVERGNILGGILNQCTHNGFGLSYFKEDLTGQEFASRFIEQISSSNIECLTDTMVLSVDADKNIIISGRNTGYCRIHANAVILASGCRERPIGSLPVAGSRPSGIYTAGAAQRMMNLSGRDLGNNFVILGSGDVGLIVARELALRGKKVIAVIEQNDRCGGLPHNKTNCLDKFDIPFLTNSTITEVHGDVRITGVTVASAKDEYLIDCDTLITSVGLVPERDLIDSFTEPLPDWLFVCGNAYFVYDIVDGAVMESERTGRLAADYVKKIISN